MHTVKNLIKDEFGNYDCLLNNNGEWVRFKMAPADPYVVDETTEWEGVLDCPISVDEINIALESDKTNKLRSLDLPAWKLALAISGDERALKELKESEAAKALIRE